MLELPVVAAESRFLKKMENKTNWQLRLSVSAQPCVMRIYDLSGGLSEVGFSPGLMVQATGFRSKN